MVSDLECGLSVNVHRNGGNRIYSTVIEWNSPCILTRPSWLASLIKSTTHLVIFSLPDQLPFKKKQWCLQLKQWICMPPFHSISISLMRCVTLLPSADTYNDLSESWLLYKYVICWSPTILTLLFRGQPLPKLIQLFWFSFGYWEQRAFSVLSFSAYLTFIFNVGFWDEIHSWALIFAFVCESCFFLNLPDNICLIVGCWCS